MTKVGFIGLTHLGIVTSIAFSKKKINVVAYDTNIKKITDGKVLINVKEPFLEDALKNNNKILFTENLSILLKCQIIYVAYDVPTDRQGSPNYFQINQSLKLLNKNKYKGIVVIHSQIRPGFMNNISKKNFKNIYYHVETLVFGEAFNRALNPERIIIGKSDKNMKIDPTLKKILSKFKCEIIEMTYQSAELTKIAINIFLISSITCSNFLSSLSKKLNADWGDICKSLRLDKRIGKFAYLKPNMGLSGGNLERDLTTIIDISKIYYSDYEYAQTLKKQSNKQSKWLNEQISNSLKEDKDTVGFLGIAYKENTNSVKNSPACRVINKKKYNVLFFDPIVKEYRGLISQMTIKDILKKSKIIIITSPSKEFMEIKTNFITNNFRGYSIIDPHGVFKNLKLKNIKYVTL